MTSRTKGNRPRRSTQTQSRSSRLSAWPGGLVRGAHGELVSAFGFTPAEAREILIPVTRQRGLARDYQPTDLVAVPGARPGVLVRAVAFPDLTDLLAAAQAGGLDLVVVSGFRPYATQTRLFQRRVRKRLAEAGSTISVAEARRRENTETALPGHSQHQLGTALDFSTPELGNQVLRTFAETAAGRWVRDHAADYGFVLPYTEEGRERTGYIAEPWHLRWLGRPLAAFLAADGYLRQGDVVVDDYLAALESSANQ